jgi:hypothetical protein
LIAEHSVLTKATAQAIWSKWIDVSSWSEWDKGIEFSDLSGPFEKEAVGIMKSNSGPLTSFIIKEVTPLKRFVDSSRLPFAELVFYHDIRRFRNKTRVTHRVELQGPLAFVFSLLLKSKLKTTLCNAVENLVRQAEVEK